MKNKKKDMFNVSYKILLLIKGIDAVLEIIGGFLLIYLNPARMDKLIVTVTQHELPQSFNDTIAGSLISLSHTLSLSTYQFDIIYLMFHGLAKSILIALLWNKKLWAYPISIVAFGGFIFYQIYRFTLTHSIIAMLLTIFDILMVYMIFTDYKKAKKSLVPKKTAEQHEIISY